MVVPAIAVRTGTITSPQTKRITCAMGAATNNKATTVKQVFTAALWILQNVGWCKHFYFADKQGRGMQCIFDDKNNPQRRVPDSFQNLGACDLTGALGCVEAD